MTKREPTATATLPLPLMGVLDDVLAIGAQGFRLEPNPPRIMVVFSTRSQAVEIDFEPWAGRQMIDYLVAQTSHWQGKSGELHLVYERKAYDCRVQVDNRRQPQRVEVSWDRPGLDATSAAARHRTDVKTDRDSS